MMFIRNKAVLGPPKTIIHVSIFYPLQLPMLTLLLIFFSSRFSILSSLYSSPRLSIPIHIFNFMFIIILPFSTCSFLSISFPLIYSTHLLLSPPHTYNIQSSTIISPAHIHATFYFITITTDFEVVKKQNKKEEINIKQRQAALWVRTTLFLFFFFNPITMIIIIITSQFFYIHHIIYINSMNEIELRYNELLKLVS